MNGETTKLLRRVALRLGGHRPDKRLRALWQASSGPQRATLRPLLRHLVATSTQLGTGAWILDEDNAALIDAFTRSVIAPPHKRRGVHRHKRDPSLRDLAPLAFSPRGAR